MPEELGAGAKFDQHKPLSETAGRLKNLPGARVEHLPEEHGFVINIVDQKEWKKAIEILKPIFGPEIFVQYEEEEYDPAKPDHPGRLEHQCEVSFANLTQLFIVLDESDKEAEPAGFMALQDLAVADFKAMGYDGDKANDLEGRHIAIWRDILVNRQRRSFLNATERLADLPLSHCNARILLGYTRNSAISVGFTRLAKECGWSACFGNEKGDSDLALMQELTRRYMNQEGILANQEGMPAGYVRLKGGEKILRSDQLEIAAPNAKRFKPFVELNRLQAAVWEQAEEIDNNVPVDSIAGIYILTKNQ